MDAISEIVQVDNTTRFWLIFAFGHVFAVPYTTYLVMLISVRRNDLWDTSGRIWKRFKWYLEQMIKFPSRLKLNCLLFVKQEGFHVAPSSWTEIRQKWQLHKNMTETLCKGANIEKVNIFSYEKVQASKQKNSQRNKCNTWINVKR